MIPTMPQLAPPPADPAGGAASSRTSNVGERAGPGSRSDSSSSSDRSERFDAALRDASSANERTDSPTDGVDAGDDVHDRTMHDRGPSDDTDQVENTSDADATSNAETGAEGDGHQYEERTDAQLDGTDAAEIVLSLTALTDDTPVAPTATAEVAPVDVEPALDLATVDPGAAAAGADLVADGELGDAAEIVLGPTEAESSDVDVSIGAESSTGDELPAPAPATAAAAAAAAAAGNDAASDGEVLASRDATADLAESGDVGDEGSLEVSPARATAGGATARDSGDTPGDADPMATADGAEPAPSATANAAATDAPPRTEGQVSNAAPSTPTTPAPTSATGASGVAGVDAAAATPSTTTTNSPAPRVADASPDPSIDAADPAWRQVGRALGSLRTTGSGEQQLTVKLHPAELGGVTIRITSGEAGTTVGIVADSMVGLARLQHQTPHLLNELRAGGLTDVSVDVRSEDSNGSRGGAGDARDGRAADPGAFDQNGEDRFTPSDDPALGLRLGGGPDATLADLERGYRLAPVGRDASRLVDLDL
ncbi:MAG: flagellar hook-length control protein FliK [Actinomycetota bacterium]